METSTGLLLVSGRGEEDAHIRYLSGFSAPDAFFFLQTGDKGLLLVSEMERGRAEKESRAGVQVLTPRALGLAPNEERKWENTAVALVRYAGLKGVEVSRGFPVALWEALRAAGVETKIRSSEICPQRAVKSAAEVVHIRRSQQAAAAAMREAIKRIAAADQDRQGFLKEGKRRLTAEEVRRTIHRRLLDFDCIGVDTIVACGGQAADPHDRGEGPLRAGEAIVIDIFPRSERSGYWGDLTRTVCRGKAPEPLREMYRAVAAAQKAALAAIRPGVPAEEVHAAAQRILEERGFPTRKRADGRLEGFIHGTGHGVGLEIHEAPRIGPGNQRRLEAGNVITIEPGLYYPEIGGVRIEDTVLVTEDGFRMLAPLRKVFEVGGK